jgi:hypothetical protein
MVSSMPESIESSKYMEFSDIVLLELNGTGIALSINDAMDASGTAQGVSRFERSCPYVCLQSLKRKRACVSQHIRIASVNQMNTYNAMCIHPADSTLPSEISILLNTSEALPHSGSAG